MKFPPLAAGGLCTSNSLLSFLIHLSKAYKDPGGSGGISHRVATSMLSEDVLLDLGSIEFMRAKVVLYYH